MWIARLLHMWSFSFSAVSFSLEARAKDSQIEAMLPNTFCWCKDILKTEIWCRHWGSWLPRVENTVKASCAMGTWTPESAIFSQNKSNDTWSFQTKRRGTTKLPKRKLLNVGTTDMQYIPIQLPCETQEWVFKCSRTSGVWLDMGLFWARRRNRINVWPDVIGEHVNYIWLNGLPEKLKNFSPWSNSAEKNSLVLLIMTIFRHMAGMDKYWNLKTLSQTFLVLMSWQQKSQNNYHCWRSLGKFVWYDFTETFCLRV